MTVESEILEINNYIASIDEILMDLDSIHRCIQALNLKSVAKLHVYNTINFKVAMYDQRKADLQNRLKSLSVKSS